jgi:hypothetical protein
VLGAENHLALFLLERVPPATREARLRLVQSPLHVMLCDAVNGPPARVVGREVPIDVGLHAGQRGDQHRRGREAEQMHLCGIEVAERALERRARQIAPHP